MYAHTLNPQRLIQLTYVMNLHVYYVYFFRCYVVVMCNEIYNIAPKLIILFARPQL